MWAPMRPSPIIPSCILTSRINRFLRFVPIKSVRYTPDLRPELRQLLLDGLVTAIDVIDALDVGAPLGHQPGEHQAGRGTQVRRHHRRRRQLLDTVDDGRVPLEADLGAQPRISSMCMKRFSKIVSVMVPTPSATV